jgi:hypothetical protein
MFAYIEDLVGGRQYATQAQGFVARMLADQKATVGAYRKPIVDPVESDMNQKMIFDYDSMYEPSNWITRIYGPDAEEEAQPAAAAEPPAPPAAPPAPPRDRDYVPPAIQELYDDHKASLDKYQRNALNVRFRNYYNPRATNRHKEPKAQALLHAIYADGTRKGNVAEITRILNENGLEFEDYE